MEYATINDIECRLQRELSEKERETCTALLHDAAVIIDAFGKSAEEEKKKIVSCRMVMRALGDGDAAASGVPMGASQGSMSALGYSQSWTLGSGSAGELYLSKLEKQLLGLSDRIGSSSPLEALCQEANVP